MTGPGTLALFGAGAICAALCGLTRRGRPLWALLAAASTGAGLLAGLAQGRTLEELLSPLLAVCAVSMAGLLWGKGGGDR
ncbi:MAG: hypothetical protein HFF26_00775 [Oscillospiraceae bacterium]|nr:hypothetical protein [Oscillospiraceae bacterium]